MEEQSWPYTVHHWLYLGICLDDMQIIETKNNVKLNVFSNWTAVHTFLTLNAFVQDANNTFLSIRRPPGRKNKQ